MSDQKKTTRDIDLCIFPQREPVMPFEISSIQDDIRRVRGEMAFVIQRPKKHCLKMIMKWELFPRSSCLTE